MHLATHYAQDIRYYGTARNCAVMIGEQKHKIAKAHAPHTNSRETELQLLKIVNLLQTMWFLLDNAFAGHPLAVQFQGVRASPTLQKQLLGATSFEKPLPGNIQSDGTLYARIRAVCGVPPCNIPRAVYDKDRELIGAAWTKEYGTTLHPRMKYTIRYYGKMTAIRNADNHTRKISVQVGGFVVGRRRPEDSNGDWERSFSRVNKIITLTVGTLSRCFFCGERT